MPTNAWDIVELPQKELMTKHHIVHDIVVVSAGLIMHGPAGVDKLEAMLLDELANGILTLARLPVEPHGEEFHLDVGEDLVLVEDELVNHGVKNLAHVGDGDVLVNAGVVAVDRFKPANIVVTMRKHMNIDFVCHNWFT